MSKKYTAEEKFKAGVTIGLWVVAVPILTFLFAKTLPLWAAFFVAAGIYSVSAFFLTLIGGLYIGAKEVFTKKDEVLR